MISISVHDLFCVVVQTPNHYTVPSMCIPICSKFLLVNVKQNTSKNPVVGKLLPELIFEVYAVTVLSTINLPH